MPLHTSPPVGSVAGSNQEEVTVPASTPPALTVLVVDDDCRMRELLARVLTREGIGVRLAEDGLEAVNAYRRDQQEISLVLLDVCMPRLDGPSALAELLRLDPGVRACFVSGDTGRFTPEDLLARGALGFVEKPFEFDDLLGVVRQLARPAAGGTGRRALGGAGC